MAYSDEVSSDSPIVWWRLDEASGNFSDSGSLGRAATASGTFTYSVSPFGEIDGTAVTLSGSQYAQTSVKATWTDINAQTIEFWLKTTGTGTDLGLVECGANQAETDITSSGSIRFNKGGVAVLLQSSTGLNDGNWHHVVCTKDASNAAIWVDGSLDNSVTSAASFVVNGSAQQGFGDKWSNFSPMGAKFIGSLDEIALYDGALGSTRILAHYNAAVGAADATPAARLGMLGVG